ncbi:MAG: PorP/SprF family type IX secretion system membrane protein [Bacteroidales bacterium]|nr:PorP/SprF family type IX secretion system membrane protein [Bacteroidales bacterium]
MKKSIYFALLLMITGTINAQQFPFMEGYNVNRFSLSPAYAGIYNSKTLFLDYRSDWTGIEGGPSTIQMSYSDRYKEKVGVGGRFVYDKTDIFKQTLILGTYTYEVKPGTDHLLNFGLSAGFFRNSIDLSKYYNDPDYVDDAVLRYGKEKSKIKFATDVSVLYRYKQVEAGVLFSNIMFGTAKYRDTDLSYRPFKNYLIHASYTYDINKQWSVIPTLIFRGGEHVPSQLEIAPAVIWENRFWGTLVFRTGGIYGLGFGGEIYKGVLLNYSYNLSSNVALNTFGSHQISLGLRLFDIMKIVRNEK